MRQIDLLGSVSITENGTPLRVMNSAKGCALLAYLIVTGKPQQREYLASLLWSGVSTSRSLQNLRELLVRVRRDVPEVQTTRQTATFTPSAESIIDVIELEKGLNSADPLTQASALKLYKGELLAGFHIDGARLFSEWLTVERERLHRRVLAAYHQLCHHYHDEQMWGRGQALARAWLAVEGWSDEAVRHFMRFSAELNEYAVARRMYDSFHSRLEREIGIAPERETTRLLAQLEREQDAKIWRGLADSPLAPPADLPPSSVVPFQRNREFVGREESLKQIVEHFALSAGQAVALTGISGVGKRQAAVEFAYRYGQQFHGVYWLNFGDPHAIADEVAAIGGERGMGLYRERDQLSTAEQVRRVQRAWQESTPRLLIFDNCEDEQTLADWLPVTGGCRVLVTSRRGRWSSGVATVALDVLGRGASVRLLRRLAPALASADADRVAAELGDLPLALHLAGGFLNRYSVVKPADYLRQLRQRDLIDHPSLCGRGAEYSPTDYFRSVARAFLVSYERLRPGTVAHGLLMEIACLAGGERVPLGVAVRMVGGDSAELVTVDALTELQSLGLLTLQAGQITMHRLVTHFVRTRGSFDGVRGRVADVLTDLLDERYAERGTLLPLPFPAAHVEAVLRAELPDGSPHLPLLRWWAHFLADVEQPQRFVPFVETIKGFLGDSADSSLPPTQLADALKSFGNITLHLEGVTEARPFYERALSIYRRLDDPLKTAQLVNNLGALALMSDEPEAARAHFLDAIAAYERLPEDDFTRTRIVNALNNLTVSHTRHREWKRAEAYINRALAIVNAHLADDRATYGWTLFNHGMVAHGLGAFTQARASFRQAYELHLALYGEDKVATARAMLGIGTTDYILGDLDAASEWLTRGLNIFEQERASAEAASGYLILGKVQLAHGRYGVGVRSLQRADALYGRANLRLPSRDEVGWLLATLTEA